MIGAPLMRGSLVRARGAWSGKAADVVVLAFDDRHRRRLTMTGVHGTAFLLDLPDALTLRSGDAVQLADGRLIEVLAAPEALVEVSAPNRPALVRIAWHLGNRHLPVQLVGERLRLRRDHVIEAMVEGLGGRLRVIDAPFDPEGGAYADHGGGGHHASHGHHAHG